MLRSFFILLALVSAHYSFAQDANNALYDPVAPAGSAFVRVLNITDSATTFAVKGKQSNLSVAPASLSGFMFVAQGSVDITVGELKAQYQLAAENVVTLVYSGSALVRIDDVYFDDRKKSMASFYNVTDQSLSLKTADGKHPLFSNIPAMSGQSRKVNEIKVALAAFDASSNKLGSFNEQLFQKGRSFSFVIYGKSGNMTVLQTTDAVEPIL